MRPPGLKQKLVILAFVVSRFPAPHAIAEEARNIARTILPSVVLLTMQDKHGQPLAIGSGFVVGSGLVATNYHLIEGSAAGFAKLVGKDDVGSIAGVVAVDAGHDLVLLSISRFDGAPLAIGDSSTLQVGDTVYAVGNPSGLEGTFSQGIVSGRRNVGNDVLLQITAAISPGSSGGPVVDKSGAVVGVAVAAFTTGQNLNFAIPAEYVRTLLKDQRPVRPLSEVMKGQREDSVLDKIGKNPKEAVVVTHFAWVPPLYLSSIDSFEFSVRNDLPYTITTIDLLLAFYDDQHRPIDSQYIHRDVRIAPGLAERVRSAVSSSVRELTKSYEFRVLDYEIAR